MYAVTPIFLTLSTGEYGDFIIDAINSGAAEIDDHEKKNIFLFAGKQTGVKL